MAAPRSLAQLPIKQRALIASVDAARKLRVRLLEMGLVPGTEVTVTRKAPLGDPLELELRGYCLSIRKADAEHILLESEPPP